MHSRFVSVSAIAVITLVPMLWMNDADAADPGGCQEILVECPVWEWDPSPIPGVEYELCFDDVDHCVTASIGSSVCIPSLGAHDVWVTAIDHQGAEPIYYDGDIVPIVREVNADFDGSGAVGFPDLGLFVESMRDVGPSPADFDGDGVVGFLDFSLFANSFGKCVDPTGTFYQECP